MGRDRDVRTRERAVGEYESTEDVVVGVAGVGPDDEVLPIRRIKGRMILCLRGRIGNDGDRASDQGPGAGHQLTLDIPDGGLLEVPGKERLAIGVVGRHAHQLVTVGGGRYSESSADQRPGRCDSLAEDLDRRANERLVSDQVLAGRGVEVDVRNTLVGGIDRNGDP
ncbi:hypothetical protein D3C72_1514840 [compost metagenome]